MKKIFIVLVACALSTQVKAQFFDRLKNKVQQKVNDAVDKTIDNATTGKKKNGTSGADSSTNGTPPAPNENNSTQHTPQEDIKAYSKFDFVPGEKIIVEENFANDAIGEFPAKWNTKTSAEVVTLNTKPGKWLAMKQDGVFYPEYIPNLPDNFTLQVDVMASKTISNIGTLTIALIAAKSDYDKFESGYGNNNINTPGIKIDLRPQSGDNYTGSMGYSTTALGSSSINDINDLFHAPAKNFATVSIWRQKQRVRVYLNGTKLLDLPRAIEANAIINSLVFGSYAPDYDKNGGAFYLGNIRLAVGAPDTRNKLITQGKFVTHGILFDFNSAQIKPQSNGALQDIANVLKEDAKIRVKIVGHTDADGDAQVNLDLSKRRAEAVKAILAADYGIDASRIVTDGKGKTQPIDNNTTTEGKANNRRVEFIKI
ncbi:OmpA family protein [Pedobacter sp. PAMC26386]|nr:OmpA family protein [Pedobacter sp. PAMC26386]